MKRKTSFLHRFLPALLAASLAWSPSVYAVDEELYNAQVQSFDDQISDIQGKQQQAQEELAAIRSDRANAWEEMEKLDELIEYNNMMKSLAEGQLDTINGKLNATKEEIEETEQKIAAQEDAFLERMVQNYMDDGTDFIELLLGSKSLIDFLTKLDRVNAILDYDRDIIHSLSESRDKLENARAEHEKDEEDQKNKIEIFQNTVLYNQSLYDQKVAYTDSLTQNEAAFMEQYAYYKEQENQKDAELKEYIQYMADQRAAEEAARRAAEEAARKAAEEAARKAAEEAARKAAEEEAARQQEEWAWQQSQWETSNSYSSYEDDYSSVSYYNVDNSSSVWPLEQGVHWQVTSGYGWRNLYGVTDFHLGIDLGCANGTNVYAYNGGIVLKSEYHWSYGNYVMIDHLDGTQTLYAHMSECLVSAGETVSPGQHIGYVGLTGNTFGYHLHFEYRINGDTTDPAPYLGIY